ncbi:MAG: holin [Coriobacteriia bacterium]|nr:holin [Coriobacteriia bacterium]MCL2537177.1 holin [Coriobacteriia bacterium]
MDSLLYLRCQKWLVAASIRAVKTAAQAASGMLGASALIESVEWRFVLSATLMAAVVSYLTSLAGLPEHDDCC